MTVEADWLRTFAQRYTVAWCSQNAASVAAHFAPTGSLKINSDAPSVGRAAVAAAAQSFMTNFPDLQVLMDEVILQPGDRAIYHWTLFGTNSGPGGTGHRVRISGFEEWTFSPDGLIVQSLGHFDQALYAHQLRHGLEASGLTRHVGSRKAAQFAINNLKQPVASRCVPEIEPHEEVGHFMR